MKNYFLKRIKTACRAVTVLVLSSLLFVTGCKKDLAGSQQENNLSNKKFSSTSFSTHLDSLIAYKNSVHHLFVGYLVGDGNDPAASLNPAISPDSADFLEFFSGRDTSKADWRTAQAKGTRLVVCHFASDAYFDGSAKDPATQVPGYVNPPGFSQTTPTSTSTYNHWASDMYAQHITRDHLDGIDIDIESGTFGGDLPQSNGPACLTAVAKYFGPNCTLCTVPTGGKKPVFFYDTDGSANDNAMYTPYKTNYDYVLFQSYTTGSHYYSGNGTAGFPALVSMYGLNKLIFLVNGDSFIYPNGTQDQPGGDAAATSSLYSYANWVVSNNGVGVGTYRMSRDYNHTPPFAVSRHAIQIMNPSAGSGSTGSGGVVFYANVGDSGTATTAIPKGNYNLTQLKKYGFVKNWASSVIIPAGWKVTMYKGSSFTGTSWVLTSSNSSFLTLSPSANDVVNSVKIQ